MTPSPRPPARAARVTCDECGKFAFELYYVENVRGSGINAGNDGMICERCRQNYDRRVAPADEGQQPQEHF